MCVFHKMTIFISFLGISSKNEAVNKKWPAVQYVHLKKLFV